MHIMKIQIRGQVKNSFTYHEIIYFSTFSTVALKLCHKQTNIAFQDFPWPECLVMSDRSVSTHKRIIVFNFDILTYFY